MSTKQIFSSILLLLHLSYGFYLPGLAPVNYCIKNKQSDSCKVKQFSNCIYLKF
jgi:hypothetical protein